MKKILLKILIGIGYLVAIWLIVYAVKEENDGRRVYRNARNPDTRKGRKSENKKFSKDLWWKSCKCEKFFLKCKK